MQRHEPPVDGSRAFESSPRRAARWLIAVALATSAAASLLVTGFDSEHVSAAPVSMPNEWIVTCDSSTNSLSVTPSPGTFPDGTPVGITLFQGDATYRFSAGASISNGIARAQLGSLVNPSSLPFPEPDTLWSVALTQGGNDYFRVDVVRTEVIGGTKTCVPVGVTVFSVTVTKPDELPLDGARVVAVPVQPCGVLENNVVLSARPNGTYVATKGMLSQGFYRVGIVAPEGFATQWWDGKPCEETVPVTVSSEGTVTPSQLSSKLSSGRVATVVVKDTQNRFVNRACVTAYTWAPGAGWGSWLGVKCAETTDGTYSVAGIPVDQAITLQIVPDPALGLRSAFFDARTFSGTSGFVVEADGKFTSAISALTLENVVTLVPGGRFNGTVSNDAGTGGVPGVCVSAVSSRGEVGGSGCTNQAGEFSIEVDGNESYRLRFDGSQVGRAVRYFAGIDNGVVTFAPTWESASLIATANPYEIPPFTLPVGAKIDVSLTPPDGGSPITNACVTAWRDNGTGSYTEWANSTCQLTGGVYSVGGLDSGGSYKISVDASGYRSAWSGGQDRDTAVPMTAPSSITVPMSIGVTLTVDVQLEGESLSDACVGAYVPTRTGDWGNFVGGGCVRPGQGLKIGGLVPGSTVALRASSISGRAAAAWLGGSRNNLVTKPFAERALFVVPQTDDVLGTVTLAPSGMISGNAKVNGVGSAGVCADAVVNAGGGAVGAFLGRGCSDRYGDFTIRGLPTGISALLRYTAPSGNAVPAWFKSGAVNGVAEAGDATGVSPPATNISVDLRPGNSVDVTVTDGSNPVPNICVYALGSNLRPVATGCSDALGRARIRGLVSGTYSFWLESFNSSYRSGRAVDDSSNPVQLEVPGSASISLRARVGATVSGTVKLGGIPVAGACVIADSGTPGVPKLLSCSDTSGSYRITSLDPAREYTCTVVESQVPARFATTSPTACVSGDLFLTSLSLGAQSITVETQAALTVSVLDRTANSVTIGWTPTGGEDYTVSGKVGGLTVVSVSSATSPVTILGLQPNVPYSIEVSSMNDFGSVPILLDSALPDPPAQPTVEQSSESTATFTWPPVSSPGSPVRYIAYLFDSLGNVVAESNSDAPSARFTGLASPATYVARVVAVNRSGSSGYSPASPPVTVQGASPSVPRSLVGSQVVGGLKFDWSPPEFSGSTNPISYTATLNTGQSCDTSITSCTFTGLVIGSSYTVTVQAYSLIGRSPPVITTLEYSGLSAPSSPRNVVGEPRDGKARVSWIAPESTGGKPILGYTVTADPGGRSCSSTTASSCTISKLTNGETYTFEVVARNEIGTSSPGTSEPVLVAVPPSAPKQLKVSTATRTSIGVRWERPSSTGGLGITGYQLRISMNGGRTFSEWSAIAVGPDVRSYIFTGLSRNSQVTVQVRATNVTFTGESASVKGKTLR